MHRHRHGIGLVTLLVPDYAPALSFYVDTLGFDLVEDSPMVDAGEGRRWVVVAPPGGGGAALNLARAETEGESQRIGDQTGGRVAFILYTDDFERDHDRMVQRGVTFLEEPRYEPYGTVAVFADPFGNRWDLMQLAGS